MLCKYDLPKDFAFSPILALFKSTLLIGRLIAKCCLAAKGCFHPLQWYIETQQCQPEGQRNFHVETKKKDVDTLSFPNSSATHFSLNLPSPIAPVVPYSIIPAFPPRYINLGAWLTVTKARQDLRRSLPALPTDFSSPASSPEHQIHSNTERKVDQEGIPKTKSAKLTTHR